MTRMHFEAIAKALSNHRNKVHEIMFIHLVEDMANMLQNTNPRFNKSRFMAACLQ